MTVRLDPKLRYLAEIGARKQRRTLSSFIEWAIEHSLESIVLQQGDEDPSSQRTLADEVTQLWDVDEADRFVKLAARYPELLTYEEQVLWKLVRENGFLWRGQFSKHTDMWSWEINDRALNHERLRENWDIFRAVASGSESKSNLPKWTKVRPATPVGSAGSKVTEHDPDDEIPF